MLPTAPSVLTTAALALGLFAHAQPVSRIEERPLARPNAARRDEQTAAAAQPQERADAHGESAEASASADEAESATTLDTLVVSAQRGTPLSYPGGRDVIEPDTIESYPSADVATVLRRTPGVYFLPENGNDSRISIGLRGNDPRRSALTAVLVDGIPISEGPYGNTDIDGMPIAFDRVWRIDVIRGGASVRYGPNSAGGIINFLTEPVPDTPMLRLGSRVGSDGDYAESLAVGGTWERFGVLFSGVVKGGDGFRDNSEYENRDGSIKMRYALTEQDTLSAYVSRFVEPHAEQPGGLTQAAYEADPDQSLRQGSTFDFDMDRYVLAYEHEVDEGSRFELKAWYQEGTRVLEDFRPVVPPFTTYRDQNSDFYSSALEASYSWRAQWLGVEHSFFHSARFLAEGNDEVYPRTPFVPGPTTYDLNADFKTHAFSGFTEDVIALAPTLDWGLGFRFELIDMYGRSHADGNEIVQDYSELLPETNLTWRFQPRTALYASYQRGFYPPQYETGFDPASVLFAPTEPEHSDAFELGLRSREIDGLEATVALFDTEFQDKIDFINTPDGKVPINTGHARAFGLELGLDYDFGAASDSLDGLELYGTLTLQRSRVESGDNEGNDTPNAPHVLASWGASYEHARSGLWGRFGGSFTDDAFKDLANTTVGSADGLNGPEPSYVLWDVAAGWHQRPDRTGFSLSAGVVNLTDEDYFRRFATGIYPGAPRQAYAAVSYTMNF